MSEKKKGLFGRMFSPNGDTDDEPSDAQIHRWLNEPDGRGGVRPSGYHGGAAPGQPGIGRTPGLGPTPGRAPGLGMDNTQRRAFNELAGGFSGGNGAYFPVEEEEEDDEGAGVEIAGIGPSGPLADAGLREGDIIVAVDGVAVDTEEDLMQALSGLLPGRSAVLEVLRNDNRMTATVIAPS